MSETSGTGVTVFGFDDRRVRDGAYSVLAPDGSPVAEVSPSFWLSRFRAGDSDGAALCSGKARLVGGWIAHDPAGAEIVRLRVRPFGHHRTSLRAGAISCRSIGRAFTREWYLQAADGRILLRATGNSGLNYPMDVWAVETDGDLTLAEVVAVIELHRLVIKSKRRRHPQSAKLVRRRQTPLGRIA